VSLNYNFGYCTWYIYIDVTICLFAGDIAFRFLNYVENAECEDDDDDFDFKHQINLLDPEGVSGNDAGDHYGQWKMPKSSSVTVCDINQAMLDVGKKRAEKLGYTQGTIIEHNLALKDSWFLA
jgi:hypothetical protein